MEAQFILLTIHWQPILGGLSAIMGTIYYLSKLKIDVVDTNHGGSWKAYFKSVFHHLFKK